MNTEQLNTQQNFDAAMTLDLESQASYAHYLQHSTQAMTQSLSLQEEIVLDGMQWHRSWSNEENLTCYSCIEIGSWYNSVQLLVHICSRQPPYFAAKPWLSAAHSKALIKYYWFFRIIWRWLWMAKIWCACKPYVPLINFVFLEFSNLLIATSASPHSNILSSYFSSCRV